MSFFSSILQASAEGHIYLPENILLERCMDLLEVQQEAIAPQIANLAMDKKVVVKHSGEKWVYAAPYYYEELNCAKMMHDLNIPLQEGGWLPSEEKQIQKRIEGLEKAQGIKLDELQKRAVMESIKNGVLILTGGPGTGKTTTINTIIRYFAEEGLDIFLAAPTGRAAKRMTEATGFHPKIPFSHRCQHLYIKASGIHIRGQFLPDELNHMLINNIRIISFQEKEIHTLVIHCRLFPLINPMGIYYDIAFFCLAENFLQHYLRKINDFSQEMVVEFDERRRVSYPFHQLDEIELAYAITIHKSQGSEYAAVIMPLLSGPNFFQAWSANIPLSKAYYMVAYGASPWKHQVQHNLF